MKDYDRQSKTIKKGPNMQVTKSQLKISRDCITLLEDQETLINASASLKSELEKLIRFLEKRIHAYPDGYLSIINRNGLPSYYHVFSRTPKRSIYLSFTAHQSLIIKLAQKAYDKNVLSLARKSLLSLKNGNIDKATFDLVNAYSSLSSHRKQLVTPLILPIEQYIEAWKANNAARTFLEQDTFYITDNDERVRSKSELYIANQLSSSQIPYCYEPVLKLDKTIFRPDFIVLNTRTRKEYYWEHLGMMDTPAYIESALKKLAVYEKNGIFPGERLILSFESTSSPLDTEAINFLIHHYCL